MVNLVFNIIAIVFSIVFLSCIMISKNKAIKKIEKEKGEVAYISENKVSQRVYCIIVLVFLIIVVIDLFVEKSHSMSPGIILINMITILNGINISSKYIITSSGIGLISYANKITKFIQWNSIKDAHWNKYDSNKLSITYIYLDSIKHEELNFNKKELKKIKDIIGKYIESN